MSLCCGLLLILSGPMLIHNLLFTIQARVLVFALLGCHVSGMRVAYNRGENTPYPSRGGYDTTQY